MAWVGASMNDVARLSGPPSLWMMSGGTASACRAASCHSGVDALAGGVTQRQRGDSLGVGCGLGDALDDVGALDAQVVEQANDAIGV